MWGQGRYPEIKGGSPCLGESRTIAEPLTQDIHSCPVPWPSPLALQHPPPSHGRTLLCPVPQTEYPQIRHGVSQLISLGGSSNTCSPECRVNHLSRPQQSCAPSLHSTAQLPAWGCHLILSSSRPCSLREAEPSDLYPHQAGPWRARNSCPWLGHHLEAASGPGHSLPAHCCSDKLS